MKTVSAKSFSVFLLAISLTTTVFAETQKIDVSKSVVNWTGKKLTGAHNGTIGIKEGTLEYKNDKVTGGKIVIDMSSLKNLDLTDAESNSKLVNHLKSDDFFSVVIFPTSELVVNKVDSNGSNHTFTGDLTIKGITHPITFTATSSQEGKHTGYKGTLTIDRSKYNVRYGSKSFFNDIGNKAIDDNFSLEFNVVVSE